MSRTGPVLSRSDLSRTGLLITHSASDAGGALTASASNPSFCRFVRHSSSGGEAVGGGFAGVGWAGAGGGDDGTGPCSRGRGGGSGTSAVTGETNTATKRTAPVAPVYVRGSTPVMKSRPGTALPTRVEANRLQM